MGLKLGMLVTAVGLAVVWHAHRKNKKQQQAITQGPQSSSGHSWVKPAALLGGLGAAGYAANSYFGKKPANGLPPPPPPVNDYRSTLRDPAAIYHHLCCCAVEKRLQSFYPPNQPERLRQIAERIASSGSLEQLANAWDLPDPFALDLVRLALFDIVLLVDDSGSMQAGKRLEEMNDNCEEVAFAASLFDTNGIEIRFFNSDDNGNNIRDPRQVQDLLRRNPPVGRTPMGASLRDKILKPMVLAPASRGAMPKPLLIMIFTDGASTDQYYDTPPRVISEARRALERTQYGDNSVFYSCQVSQVGNDQAAIDYLSSLDEDKTIGDHIDVTSNVQHEMSQVIDGLQSGSANIPPHLKPLIQEEIDPNSPLWTTLFRVKRLVGAVHPWYDQSDEATGKKKRSFFSSKEAEYKAHWSEDPNYISASTAKLQSRGFDPYPIPQAPPQQSQGSWGPPPPQQSPQSQSSWGPPPQQPPQYQGSWGPPPGPPPSMSYDYAQQPPQGYHAPQFQGYNQSYQGGGPPPQQPQYGGGGYSGGSFVQNSYPQGGGHYQQQPPYGGSGYY